MSEDLIEALEALKKSLRREQYGLTAMQADDFMVDRSLLAAASFLNNAGEAVDAALDRLAER